MDNYTQNIKKFGVYALAAIGILTIIWFGWQIVSGVGYFNPPPRPYSMEMPGGGMNAWRDMPMGAPTMDMNKSLNLSGKGGGGDFLESEFKGGGQPSGDTVGGGDLTQRKVVKNSSVNMLIKDAEETAPKIKRIAEKLGGFVGDSNIFESPPPIVYPFNENYVGRKSAAKKTGLPKSGNITIRVPASNFEEAITEIKKLAIKVESENVNVSDVTEQFIDLEARLKNLRAEEEQYQEIMKKAVKIQDILDVAGRLADVRGRIEQIEGQLQYLSRQVDMSTITVSMTAEQEVETFNIRWRPFFIIKQSFKNMLFGFTGYVDKMIGFIFRLPVILVWLATIAFLAFIIWRIVKWIRRKFFLRG